MSGDQRADSRVDALDQKLIEAFPGRVVRKDLVYKLKVGFSIPVYVLEYLLGKHCSTTDEEQIRDGLTSVKQAIAERVVRADQSELIKSRLQRSGSMKLIDLVTVTFDEKDQGGKYWARLVTAGLEKVHIQERLVHEHERTLTGGVWSNAELTYDESLGSGQSATLEVVATASPGSGGSAFTNTATVAWSAGGAAQAPVSGTATVDFSMAAAASGAPS